jgi:hypothetical protein
VSYFGVYRGVIRDINDPEERKRYRVQVLPVYPAEIPKDSLPWAEFCLFGGKGFGDIPAWKVDDKVWVSFEGGDKRFPIILGGWLSEHTGTPDLPMEIGADYKKNQEKWVRMDRKGNALIMSPLPDESGVLIKSGDCELEVRQQNGTIRLSAPQRILINAPKIELDIENLVAQTTNLTAHVKEQAVVRANDRVSIQGSSDVFIGNYADAINGALLPNTSNRISLDAQSEINLTSSDTIDVDASGDITVDTPTNIIITGTHSVVVNSDSKIEANAETVTVNALGSGSKIDLNTEGKIYAKSGADISVESGAGISIKAEGLVNLDCDGAQITSSQAVDLSVNGNVSIKATGANTNFDVQANDIQMNALSGNFVAQVAGTGTISLSGGSTSITGAGSLDVSMNGSVNLYGQGGCNISTGGNLSLNGQTIDIG